MREQLEQELEKIGLAEKEAKVYLAALELGPSTAQSIAAKATVNRPTTYIMIESLIKRGLMSSFEKGKKRYFSAAPPNQLLYVLETQKKEILEKETLIKTLLPDLRNISQPNSTSTVSVYEGLAGLNAVQDDINKSGTSQILELTSIDEARKFIPPIFEGDIRKKIVSKSKVKIKSLYVNKSGVIEKQYEGLENVEFRRLTDPNFPILGEIIVYGRKVSLASFKEKPVWVVVEDQNIATTIHSMFMALWEKGKPLSY